MAADEEEELREELRRVLRVGRFHGWTADELEGEILRLFGRGVSTQTPPPADQLPVPLPDG